jgi:hypothetical protein
VGTSNWLVISRMWRVRCHRINGHLRYPTDIDRSLNEVDTDKISTIRLTIIIIPLTLSSLGLLFLVRLGGYIVNSCVFYFYKMIGKLTVSLKFCKFQEFSLCNITVVSSTTDT